MASTTNSSSSSLTTTESAVSDTEPEREVLSDVHLNVRPRRPEPSDDDQSKALEMGKTPDGAGERSLTRLTINLELLGSDGSSLTREQEQPFGGDTDDGTRKQESASKLITDEDGDLIVSRQRRDLCDSMNFITIEHAMKTKLADVGLQVWQGCLLLCNFILDNQPLFTDCIALELGGGTGLASIVMATVARRVICTDTGQDILELCQRNIEANGHVIDLISHSGERANGQILVRNLDWRSFEFDTDLERSFHWTEREIVQLADISVIIAADVIYSNHLTDAFFKKLLELMTYGKPTCFISLEKRLNFTLSDLDVTCKEYDHFRVWLTRLETEHGCSVSQHDITALPQYLPCPQSRYLELWEIKAVSGVS